jgi:hypothetical protein
MSSARVTLKGKVPKSLRDDHGLVFEVSHSTPGHEGTELSYEMTLSSHDGESSKAEMVSIDSHSNKEGSLNTPAESVERLADRLERMAQALRTKSSAVGRLTTELKLLERSESANPVIVTEKCSEKT